MPQRSGDDKNLVQGALVKVWFSNTGLADSKAHGPPIAAPLLSAKDLAPAWRCAQVWSGRSTQETSRRTEGVWGCGSKWRSTYPEKESSRR